jgi:hypothetical protein
VVTIIPTGHQSHKRDQLKRNEQRSKVNEYGLNVYSPPSPEKAPTPKVSVRVRVGIRIRVSDRVKVRTRVRVWVRDRAMVEVSVGLL